MRELSSDLKEVTDAAPRHDRRVAGKPQAEGAVRGAAVREQDLPIAGYDELPVNKTNSRLRRLSRVDLARSRPTSASTKTESPSCRRIESLRNTRAEVVTKGATPRPLRAPTCGERPKRLVLVHAGRACFAVGPAAARAAAADHTRFSGRSGASAIRPSQV